jgi:hypothetical protein
MRRLWWFLATSIIVACLPRTAPALDLRWTSGDSTIVFTSATRCTLVVQADSTEQSLPGDCQLVWVAENGSITFVPTASADSCTNGIAELASIAPSHSPADILNHTQLASFCSSEGSVSTAKYVMDLPAGAAGKFKVVALDPSDPDSMRVLESPVATFNGGMPDPFPPVILRTQSSHHSTQFDLTAVGSGLSSAPSLELAGIDGPYQQELDIVSQNGNVIRASAEVAAHVPRCTLATATLSGTVAAADVSEDDPVEVESTGDSCHPFYREGLLVDPTFPSQGIILPKDFAFVPGAWTPGGDWVYHLFYTRQNVHSKLISPDSTENKFGHASSPDLLSWPTAQQDTTRFLVDPSTSAFDHKHVWAPCIVKTGLTYNMFYTGQDANNDQAIGYATSTNLVSWTRHGPIYTASSLGSWAAPRGPLGTLPAELRDAFIIPDPDTPGGWLMYYVTKPALDPNALVVAVAKSTSPDPSTGWDGGRPIMSTLFQRLAGNQFGAIDESPTVFQAPSGKWWVTFSVQQRRHFFAVSAAGSPADSSAGNWSPIVDADSVIVDPMGQIVAVSPDSQFVNWHAAEYLHIGGSSNASFIAGWDNAVRGVDFVRATSPATPYMFAEACPFNTTGVPDLPEGSSARLTILGQQPARTGVGFAVDLPAESHGTLEIYDVRGRRVRIVVQQDLPAGRSQYRWDGTTDAGRRAGSGVYFVRLKVRTNDDLARVVLLR